MVFPDSDQWHLLNIIYRYIPGNFVGYIVHPGIDVHFDIVFLNDHCGIVLHDGVFKLFLNVDR